MYNVGNRKEINELIFDFWVYGVFFNVMDRDHYCIVNKLVLLNDLMFNCVEIGDVDETIWDKGDIWVRGRGCVENKRTGKKYFKECAIVGVIFNFVYYCCYAIGRVAEAYLFVDRSKVGMWWIRVGIIQIL